MKCLLSLLVIFPFFCLSQNNFEKAEVYFQEEKFDLAKPLFKSYLESHPNSLKSKEYLGDIASYSKDWEAAIDYYEDLVSIDAINANYHFKYGGATSMKALEISKVRALFYVSDIKEAFETAASLDPLHIETRWALVEFYMQLPGIIGGSEAKAIEYANELGNISPVDGYLANGYIAEYADRPLDAENFYKKAVEIGGSFHTYEKLSSLYEKNNQPQEAIETAAKSLKVHKRNQLNYQIGKIAAQYNIDPELGLYSLEQYVKNHSVKDGVPKDWAYFRMAQIYKNLGKKENALLSINRALSSRPDFKEALEEKRIIKAL
ncbi:MAG: tetratricopeptide (TPR) repeat protein [Ulvibacter sp.]|jgi:tetratricopeptide (TPR) repeat protein